MPYKTIADTAKMILSAVSVSVVVAIQYSIISSQFPSLLSTMIRTFIITGDTWSSRSDLKTMGGCWVPHLNAWLVSDAEQESVAYLQSRIGFNVQLVTLPIHIPYVAEKRIARSRTSVASRIPSPIAS